jgi:hypothetical protein
MNQRNNKYIRKWIEVKDSSINFIISYLNFVLSVIIEIFPQGNYVCQYRFYENDIDTDPDKIKKEDVWKLLELYSYEIDRIIIDLSRTNPKRSVNLLIALSMKPLVTMLGNFWVLNVSTINYQADSYKVESLLLPHGNILNIIAANSLSNDILLQIHSSNTKLVQKLRYERFRYLIKVMNSATYMLRFIVLLSGLISFSVLLSLELFYFNNTLILTTSFVVLGITLTTLIIITKILEKNLERRIIRYLNN